MKKCVIFASYIPTSDKLYVGEEFLNKFVDSFSEYDIYIGINNSCKEWYDLIKKYSEKLNIFFETTPNELLIDSDTSAFQTALKLLKDKNIEYQIYWFGHTKGSTSNSDGFRKTIFEIFWNKKEIIEQKILDENFTIYAPYIGVTSTNNYMNTTLSLFIDGYKNDDLATYFTFWVHSGEVVNSFIKNAKEIFYNSKLTDFKTTDDKYFLDRYFFERDFPMIYQKFIKEPKVLFHRTLLNDNNPNKNNMDYDYIINKCVKINF